MTPWWEWVMLSAAELRARSLRAEDRVVITGHRRPLPPHWALTIGMWCRAKPMDIIATAAVSRSSYDMFKSRWALRSLHQFKGIPVAKPTTPVGFCVAAACFTAMEAFRDRTRGAAAAAVAPRIGVLPVEAMLYTAAIEELCTFNSLNTTQWKQLSDETRVLLWVRGLYGTGPVEIGLPEEVGREASRLRGGTRAASYGSGNGSGHSGIGAKP